MYSTTHVLFLVLVFGLGWVVCLFVIYCCFWLVGLVWFETVFLFVDQAGFKSRDLPTSASQALRLKVCATMPRSYFVFVMCV